MHLDLHAIPVSAKCLPQLLPYSCLRAGHNQFCPQYFYCLGHIDCILGATAHQKLCHSTCKPTSICHPRKVARNFCMESGGNRVCCQIHGLSHGYQLLMLSTLHNSQRLLKSRYSIEQGLSNHWSQYLLFKADLT